MTSVEIPEDTKVGDTVFWMTVNDPTQSDLIFGITPSSYSGFFNVTNSTGEVTLRALLDYETTTHFEIEIFVLQLNERVTKYMLVKILDRNDNKPIFMNTVSSISISEILPPGSVIYNATAKDADSGLAGSVIYNISGVVPNNNETKNLFTIEINGSVILQDKLSYNNKSSSYQLKLGACDRGGEYNGKHVTQCSDPFYLSITVIDEADLDPQFLREFYSASVAEDAPEGTSVLKVEAVDGDKGLNWELTYSITDSTNPGWFRINSSSGVIEVDGPLDREENEEVRLQVTATETKNNTYGQMAKTSTWVTLTVTDVNDNVPEFFNCSFPKCAFSPQERQNNFSGSVDEHASTRIPIDNLTMVVYDPDKGTNGTFTLTLVGPGSNAFSVSPERASGSADVQVLVKNSTLVDFEKTPVITVKVVANDTESGNTSEANVTIYLRDINDHRPTFPQQQYDLKVQENCTKNVVIENITAYDEDQGYWGEITYSLVPGSGADNFEVNSTTGGLFVKDCSLLDREKQSVYYLTLQATDSGGQSTTTNLQITLEDINDNPPQVIGTYNIFVEEGENSTVSECIQAIDVDEPGTNNSLLQFKLEDSKYSSNFSVNATGCIFNKGPLDREAIDRELDGRIVLTVNVSDCGNPVLSTLVNVTITVEDINDNSPVFSLSSYNFSVNERESDVQVGVVDAWDADQTTANNRISFRLSGSGSNNFIMKANSSSSLSLGQAEGLLWLPPDVTLDYETQKTYNFNVTAENPDPGSPSATASVVVWVLDVNDEQPVLVASSLKGVTVAENGTQQGEVTQVKATDPDTTAQLEIQQVNVFCHKDGADVGSLCSGWFSVLPSGSVVIRESTVIDYETCDQVTLVVRAHDKNTKNNFQAYSSNGTLVITIQDVNDNAPYFLPIDKTFVIIWELMSPGKQVADVQARDNDSVTNGNIRFSISKVEFVPKKGPTTSFPQGFRVMTISEGRLFTGNIELVTSLDNRLQGTYEVTVQAQDIPSIGSPLETQTTLNIFTVDQSYRITLEFSSSKDEVGANVEKIKTALGLATRTTVYVVDIKDKDAAARAQGHTYLDAYFVYPNGTALTLDQLSVMIRGDQSSLKELLDLGLVVLGAEDKQNSDVTQRLTGVIIGLGVALALLIAIMTTALVCVRRSYKRELRAVKAAKEARQTVPGVTSTSSAIPGTNVYNSDRANPMLNLATKDLGFESQSSSSDVDRTSLNSLDENSVDLGKEKEKVEKKKEPQKKQKEAAKVPQQDQTENKDEGFLSAVLSDRKESTSREQRVAFSNPTFDDTEDSTI
ncbi:cadherin-related family member 2 [Sorex araneus]|uniref:cadherin-related family member 2 n=1 Tax=Sorex araneus TaxID=42254 RepID=UPI002433EE47|nr:cadherin-related family member 2 [Sorex araneus]